MPIECGSKYLYDTEKGVMFVNKTLLSFRLLAIIVSEPSKENSRLFCKARNTFMIHWSEQYRRPVNPERLHPVAFPVNTQLQRPDSREVACCTGPAMCLLMLVILIELARLYIDCTIDADLKRRPVEGFHLPLKLHSRHPQVNRDRFSL